MFPRFDSIGIKPSEIDSIVLTHAHFDHIGFVPALFKYGYNGPVYLGIRTNIIFNVYPIQGIYTKI